MAEAKHTPGPWIQMGTSIGVTYGEIASVWEIDGRSFANARLIAAAPELLKALQSEVENAEQGAFEEWLTKVCPSGDSEAVDRQWQESSDFKDFCEDWKDSRAAIAKATGGQP